MKNKFIASTNITIHASKQEVWDALTKPELIKKYFFNTNTHTDWKPGSPIEFTGEWEGKTYRDKGKVLEVEKPDRIKYTYWSSMSGIEDKEENYAVITYKLSGSNGDVKLEVIQENVPNEKMKEHSTENWNMVLEGLRKMLEEKSEKKSHGIAL